MLELAGSEGQDLVVFETLSPESSLRWDVSGFF